MARLIARGQQHRQEVESLTHAAVLTRPELLGEAFVRDVTAAVYRYLTG